MNAGTISHIPDDLLEEYALGRVPARDSAPLDEHLLICPTCQYNLKEIDEYILVMKAAIAALPARFSKTALSRLLRLQSNALTT